MRIYAFYTFFTLISQMFEDKIILKKKEPSDEVSLIEVLNS